MKEEDKNDTNVVSKWFVPEMWEITVDQNEMLIVQRVAFIFVACVTSDYLLLNTTSFVKLVGWNIANDINMKPSYALRGEQIKLWNTIIYFLGDRQSYAVLYN